MSEYTVEFRIHGKDLDVSSVTNTLGLEPCLIRRVGERRDKNTQWDEAMWSFNGLPESAASRSWDSLEEGLSFVLEKLWPLKSNIDSYKPRFRLLLWCGHFYSDFDGGLTLSVTLLKRLGEFGVELHLGNYFSDDSAIEGSD